MNRLSKIILSVMGGIDVLFYTITPILISMIWTNLFGINDIGAYIMYAAGLISSVFRGIKVGWLKR